MRQIDESIERYLSALDTIDRTQPSGEPRGLAAPRACGDYDLGLIRLLRFFCAFLGFGDAVRMGTDTRQFATVHY
jgi:hypothetical protein